jgi:hypothetical protein
VIPIAPSDFNIEIGWIKQKNNSLSPLAKEFMLMLQETLIIENQMNLLSPVAK